MSIYKENKIRDIPLAVSYHVEEEKFNERLRNEMWKYIDKAMKADGSFGITR